MLTATGVEGAGEDAMLIRSRRGPATASHTHQ